MRVLRIGHRGAAGHAPENTRASIQKAIALGADFAEVDVRSTQDGHLVILHDERVDRTTDGTGAVSEMTWEEVRKLDAGGGQRIPMLQEVLEVAEGHVGLILEMKAARIAEAVATRVRQSKFSGPAIFASFLHSELLEVRQAMPSATTMALLERDVSPPPTYFTDLMVSHVGLPFASLTGQWVETLHSAGFRIFVYTVNNPSDIEWVKSFGVEGIISDFPERI